MSSSDDLKDDFREDINDSVHDEIEITSVHDAEKHKLDENYFSAENKAEMDRQFAELEQEGRDSIANHSFFERMISFEFEMHFKNKKHMTWLLGGFAAAAGLLSGLDQSIISAAKIEMRTALSLDDNQESLISALMPLGAMAGSLIMPFFNRFFGRRGALFISCLFYTAGAGLCAGARSYEMMYAGRFLLGVGVGIEGGCVGIYISESVPANVRGNLVSMYQLNIALGEVLGYAVGAIFFEVHGGWRFMLGSSLVFSTALAIGLLCLPESPRWLVSKHRVGEAWLVWKRLRDADIPSERIEFLEMRQAARHEEKVAAQESWYTRYFELFTIPRNRRALVYAVIMVTLGQMTGINAIMYNMSNLMSAIGFDDKKSVFMSLVGGGSLLIGTIPAILYMDRFGRRVWSQSIVGFFIGLILVGVGYTIDVDTNRSAALGVYFTGLIMYMMFFGTYACLTWVLPSESFDMRTRAQGMAICSMFLYLWSFIVTFNFTRMTEAMTYPGLAIGFFGGLGVVGFFYQLLFMPETKDKTLEEIDDLFNIHTWELAKLNLSNLKKGKISY